MQTAVAIPQPSEENSDWRKDALVVAGTVVVVGGAIWGVVHLVRKANEKREQKKSLEEGTPATLAKQLKMAFDNDGWWGTNVPLVRKTFQEIPSKDFYKRVERSYSALTKGNSLPKDLEEELTSTEYSEVLKILASKPEKKGGTAQSDIYENWAERLKAAFDYTVGVFEATDEDAINAVYREIPTQYAYAKVEETYYSLYGKKLYDDLISELWDSDADELVNSIKQKPMNG
jgi:hypothetical protein